MALDVNGTAYVGTRAGVLLAIGPRACSTCSLPARDVKSLLHLYPRTAHSGSTYVSRAPPCLAWFLCACPCRSFMPQPAKLPLATIALCLCGPSLWRASEACSACPESGSCGADAREETNPWCVCAKSPPHSPAYTSHCLAPIACRPAFPCVCVCVCDVRCCQPTDYYYSPRTATTGPGAIKPAVDRSVGEASPLMGAATVTKAKSVPARLSE